MIKKGVKDGQFQLSFSFLFSLILIAVFVFVAFYVIYSFLDINDSTDLGAFSDNLQKEIDLLYRSTGGTDNKRVSFEVRNEKITHVCFFDFNKGRIGEFDVQYEDIKKKFEGRDNMYFYPRRETSGFDSAQIEHIDMENFNQNPYCIQGDEGKFVFVLNKGIQDSLVKISRG